MGWGSRCPSDGGCSPRRARRRDTAPFPGRCWSHPHHSGLIGGYQGLDRHPWLGHAQGERVLRPPQRERAAAEGPPGGLKAPRAEQSLAGARQAEGRQCLGGAGVIDIHHPPGQSLAAIGSSGTRGPPPETGEQHRKERCEGSRAEVASGATGKVQEGSGEGAGKGREGPRDQQLRVHIPGETSVFRDRSDRAGLCPGLQRGLLVSPLPREDGPVPSAA